MATSTQTLPTAYASSLDLPSYHAWAASPVPRFDRWKDAMPRFPYPVVDAFEDEPRTRTYRTLVLENEHLRATALPELGGRLYSLLEKASGRELFYRNPVIKPALVAAPGAWIAGGLEFNLPFGHNLGGFRPVHAHLEAEGSERASITLGQIDRVTGMRWSVELSLERDSRALAQRSTLYNRTPLAQRYFIWSNAAVAVDDATRFLYPMRMTYSDEYPEPVPWPFTGGADLRLHRSHPRPTSLFDVTQSANFFGVYDEDRDEGLVHWASPRDMPGKKLWTWGVAHDGRIWTEHLTDDGQPYVEIQSGLFEDQRDFELLEPWRRLSVSEVWYPVEGLGTVTSAGRWAAASLARVGNRLECRLQANAPLPGASVSVLDEAGRPLAEPAMRDLAPGRTVTLSFDLVRLPPVARLAVRRADGALALECTWETAAEGRLAAPAPPVAHAGCESRVDGTTSDPAAVPEATGDPAQAAGQADAGHSGTTPDTLETGERLERLGDWAEAAAAYTRAVADTSGAHTGPADGAARAHVGLARVRLHQGLPVDALRHASAAVPHDPLACYYAAVASLATGDEATARHLLARTWVFEAARRASEVALACLDLTTDTAAAVADTAGSCRDPRYGALGAAALRRLGLPAAGLAAAEAVAAGDPLEPLAAWERVLATDRIGDETAAEAARRRWELDFAASPEAVYTVVADYVSMGWHDDALSLDGAAGHTEATDTVAAWTRLFLAYARTTGRGEADNTRDAGAADVPETARLPDAAGSANVPAAGVDPTLRQRVLAWATHQPELALDALRLLGELLFDVGRTADAAAAWESAAARGARDPVLWRDLALGRMALGFTSAARQAYAHAATLAPDDPRVLEERVALLLAVDDAPGAANVARQGLGRNLTHSGFRVAALEALLAVGDLDAALELLRGPRFHMAEGQRWPRQLYLEAWLRSGAASYAAARYQDAAEQFAHARRYPVSFGIGESARPESAQAAYLEGLACRALGDAARAAECFRDAAGEAHAPDSELSYYTARASAALGEAARASALHEAMLVASATRLERVGSNDARGCYLRGLALLGLNRHSEGERWLREAATREQATGEARAELRRRIDVLIPEERLPTAVWWVVDPAGR